MAENPVAIRCGVDYSFWYSFNEAISQVLLMITAFPIFLQRKIDAQSQLFWIIALHSDITCPLIIVYAGKLS